MVELSYKQKLTKVKYWLTAAEYCQRKIEAYIEEKDKLRSLAEKCTTNHSHAPASGGPYDRMGSAAIRMVEYEQKIQKEIKELLDRKERIQAVITNCLEDYNQRIVMEYRSACGQPLSGSCACDVHAEADRVSAMRSLTGGTE